MRPAIERLTAPPYPTTSEGIAYAENYRVNYFVQSGNPKGYHIYNHNSYVDITVCGGLNNYFIVYAYSPGGFWYALLDELITIESWRAWIFHYHPPTQSYTIEVYTSEDGFDAFEALKLAIGL